MIGGFILGIGETFLVALGFSTFSDAFTFILLIVMLLVKPTGLFGEKATEKV
jgi:branched-chain amino acid transport system permease protein